MKGRQVLEILAVHGGRVVSKSSLAEWLWPRRGHGSTDPIIETHVSLLRRALGEAGAVETFPRGYRLGPVELDLRLFDQLVADGSLASLRRAIGLADAEVGEHDPEAPWFDSAREHYSLRLTEALSQAGQLALGGGRLQMALDYSAQALERDPFREVDCQTSMTAHYLAGDRSASLTAFERCRRRLRKHLGIDPGSLTNAVHRCVLMGLPIELALGTVKAETPRALVIEPDGRRQGLLVEACGIAGCTSELVADLGAALARVAARGFDVVVVSAAMVGLADLDEVTTRPVIVGDPQIGVEALAATIAAELASSSSRADMAWRHASDFGHGCQLR